MSVEYYFSNGVRTQHGQAALSQKDAPADVYTAVDHGMSTITKDWAWATWWIMDGGDDGAFH